MNKISRAIRNAISTIDGTDPHARNRIYTKVRAIAEKKITNQTNHDLGQLQNLLYSLEDSIAEIEGEFALKDAMHQLAETPSYTSDSKSSTASGHRDTVPNGRGKWVTHSFAALLVLVVVGLAWNFKSDVYPSMGNGNDKPSQEIADKQMPLEIEFILSDGNSVKPFIVKGRGSAVKSSGDDAYISVRSIRQASRPDISAKPILLPLDVNAKNSVVNGLVMVTITAKSGRSEDTKLYVSCIFYALAKCKYEEFILGKEKKKFSYFIFTEKSTIPKKRLFILLGTDPGRKNDEQEKNIGTADIFSIKLRVLPL